MLINGIVYNKADKVEDVCNLALLSLGEETCVHFEADHSASMAVCRRMFVPVAREVQSLLLWPELKSFTFCSRAEEDVVYGASFYLPENCLRVLAVRNAREEVFYSEVGDKLFVQPAPSGATVDVLFQRFIPDPSAWSPLLLSATVKLLAARLYAALAHDLSGSAGLEQRFFAEFLPSIESQVMATAQVRGANMGLTVDSLCESALQALGVPQVPDWRGDAALLARALRSCLFPVMREVQSLTRWPELIVSATMQWTGARDDRGYCYYTPERCLRVLKAGHPNKWVAEGKYIYVREIDPDSPQECRYVRFSANPAEWSSELYSLTVKLLAARVAASGLGDAGKAAQLENQFWQQDRPRVVTQVLNRSRRSSKQLNYEF